MSAIQAILLLSTLIAEPDRLSNLGTDMKLRQAIIVIALLEISITLMTHAGPPEVAWEILYTKQGIRVEKGLVAESPYHALRGTGIAQTSIGRTISILYDHTRANQWVHDLAESIELRDDALSKVVWQRYTNPWPVRNRDFTYLAEPHFNEKKKYFQAWMTDISDTDITLSAIEQHRIRDQSCCIAGKLIYGSWQFRPTGPASTCVRVEIMFDPKGYVPPFVVNQFQTNWPFNTIQGLQEQALKNDIVLHEIFGGWLASDASSMITPADCMNGKLQD